MILAPDSTVAEALARIRNSDLPPALAAQVYVCRPPLETPTGRYLGSVHFQRLLREPPSALVTEAVDSELEPRRTPRPPCTRSRTFSASYNLVAIPVVDENDRLLGAVTVDDVIDHMLPDNWRNQEPRRAVRGRPMARELRRSRLDQPRGPRAECAPPTTRRPSASSPSGSAGSSAPGGSSSG